MNEKLANRIISVAYGDVSLWEKFKIRQLAKKNPAVNSMLDEYTKIAEQTHNIDLESCPNEIIDKTKHGTKSTQTREQSIFFDLYSFLFRRPVISIWKNHNILQTI